MTMQQAAAASERFPYLHAPIPTPLESVTDLRSWLFCSWISISHLPSPIPKPPLQIPNPIRKLQLNLFEQFGSDMPAHFVRLSVVFKSLIYFDGQSMVTNLFSIIAASIRAERPERRDSPTPSIPIRMWGGLCNPR